MRIDIVDLTDRIRDLIDYYTDKDVLLDLDAWNSDDLREMVGLLTKVLHDRNDIATIDDIYSDSFDDWVERQIDQELADQLIEEAWDEYIRENANEE